MAVEITSRHMKITAAVKDFARDKADMILEEFTQVEHVHIILDRRDYDLMAEVVVQGKNKLRAEASDRAATITAAIDSAVDKIVAQLRKARKKTLSRRVGKAE